jgi:hypothetical protein
MSKLESVLFLLTTTRLFEEEERNDDKCLEKILMV